MNGIFIGYKPNGEIATYKKTEQSSGEGHLFLSAPPRSGKARDILIPALLHYGLGVDAAPSSCIVIDPKGQLAAVTGPQRARMGQRVIILNPFEILPDVLGPDSPQHFGALTEKEKSRVIFNAKFNPLVALDPAASTFSAECENVAESLVTREGGDHATHWSNSARGLVAGVIAHLAANCSDKLRNLAELYKIIGSDELLYEAATHAKSEAEAGGDALIAQALSRFAKKGAANEGEIRSIISTAETETRFIGNRAIAQSLSGSDFDFATLKDEPTTVYLVLPVRFLASCGKWFRLVLASALDALLTEKRGLPVLCVLDEFAQLGKLGIIENCLGLAAGMGVQLWPVLQDLTQLQELYPKRWESFLGCAGVQMFFAPRENTSANYISELCGDTTVKVQSESSGISLKPVAFGNETTGINSGTSIGLSQRRAVLPQEVRQLPGTEFLMFWDGLPGRFIRAHRKPYWQIPECRGLFSPDPYHLPKRSPASPAA